MGEDGRLDGWRVLVVEDHLIIAEALSQLLEDDGAEVVGPAPSVALALSLVEGEPPDAAVLDVNLGEHERVFPVAEELDRLGVPFVFATAYGREAVPARWHDRPVLAKPLSPSELIDALVRVGARTGAAWRAS